MKQIVKGDIVKLKSGGPLMTVADIKGQLFDKAICNWFEPTNTNNWEIKSFIFDLKQLEVIKQ